MRSYSGNMPSWSTIDFIVFCMSITCERMPGPPGTGVTLPAMLQQVSTSTLPEMSSTHHRRVHLQPCVAVAAYVGIDDGAFRLQPLALDLHGSSLRRNDVVGLPLTLRTNAYILQQTGRDIGVTVRELASHVLVTQQQRNRKTDVVAATNHRRLLLF